MTKDLWIFLINFVQHKGLNIGDMGIGYINFSRGHSVHRWMCHGCSFYAKATMQTRPIQTQIYLLSVCGGSASDEWKWMKLTQRLAVLWVCVRLQMGRRLFHFTGRLMTSGFSGICTCFHSSVLPPSSSLCLHSCWQSSVPGCSCLHYFTH